MLRKQIYRKNVIFVTIGILKILFLSMNHISVMSFNNVAIVYVKGSAHRIHFWYVSKGDAINIMNGSDLVNKRGVL